MERIDRFQLGFRTEDDGEPGLFLKEDGAVWVRQPNGSESLVGSGGGSMPGQWYFADIQFDEPEPWTNYPITGVDTDAGTFTIAGDHTEDFPEGSLFGVGGSTGNDNFYKVGSVEFAAGHTIIAAANDWIPTDPTADGVVIQSLVATLPIPAGSAVLDLRAFGVAEFNSDHDATWQIGDSRDPNAYSGAGDPAGGEVRLPVYDPAVSGNGAVSIYDSGGVFAPNLYTYNTFAPSVDGIHYPDEDVITCRAACVGTDGGNGQVFLRFLICAPTEPIVAS